MLSIKALYSRKCTILCVFFYFLIVTNVISGNRNDRICWFYLVSYSPSNSIVVAYVSRIRRYIIIYTFVFWKRTICVVCVCQTSERFWICRRWRLQKSWPFRTFDEHNFFKNCQSCKKQLSTDRYGQIFRLNSVTKMIAVLNKINEIR